MRWRAAILAGICGLLISGCALSPAGTAANSATPLDAPPITAIEGLGGWDEAVIVTSDPGAWDNFFRSIATWEKRAEHPIDDGLRDFWGLSPTAQGRQYLYANPGEASGRVRVIALQGQEQGFQRRDDRPWDTGGLFNFNVRVSGMDAVHARLSSAGWQGESAPKQYTFGKFEVIEWVARGPDGVRVAFIERLSPMLEGWPNLKQISRTFNSTQTVSDMAAAREFYSQVLGMKPYLEWRGVSDEPEQNALGLFKEATVQVYRDVVVLHPDGVNEGSVELLKFEGASGRKLEQARPYDRGLAALRYPVTDLTATMLEIRKRGGVFVSEPVTMTLPPYGRVRAAALLSPDGARLELYEVDPVRTAP